MNTYEIDVDEVLKQSKVLSGVTRGIKTAFNLFDPDLSCLGDSGQSVRDKLVILRDSIGSDIKRLTALSDTVEGVANEYKWSEEAILAKMQGKMIFPVGSGRYTLEAGAHEEKFKSKAKSTGKIRGYDSLRNHLKYNDKTKKWENYDYLASKDKKVDVDIKLYGKEYTDEVSVFNASYLDGDLNGKHSSGSLKIGNLSRNAGFYIGPLSGLYMGVSATALHADFDKQWGNEDAAAYMQAEVNVLKGEAKADVSIGTKNGKAHALAEFSAQALGGEASIKGGVKVGGADIGVKASVNYGVGVKAKFGLDEGVFKAELGASLGIGGGISIEVDFSGMIDKVKDNVIVSNAVSLIPDDHKPDICFF